jgi:hypothetical protein
MLIMNNINKNTYIPITYKGIVGIHIKYIDEHDCIILPLAPSAKVVASVGHVQPPFRNIIDNFFRSM